MLFSLILFCTCETYLNESCRLEVFGDRTKDVHKFDRFQVIQVSCDTMGKLVCPETQVFQCHRTATEEMSMSFAEHGNNFSFRPSLDMSCVRNDDHFVVAARVLQQVRFD